MTGGKQLVILGLALALSGCVGTPTQPSQFYLLSPEPGQAVSSRASSLAEQLSLGLGPISLPETYDRPQIVTRTSTNQIDLAEYDRWGGDLGKELGRTLAQNLMTRLNTDSIALYPWVGRYKPDFQISIQFFRFDGTLGEAASLDGIWRLLDGSQGCELAAEHFRIREQTGGEGYPELVDAISRGLARLSEMLAEQVAAAKPGCE
jgi:uncharacterized lipoprotein YmbA